jgi:sorbitol/mannitol transport system substrate-binding protein
VVADVITGAVPVAEGTAQMQEIATQILAEFQP